jgi:hypothetical protein
MPDVPMPTLFLAIPGTQETRELDLETVRSGVARGEIPLDNWAWSPQRNEWLPLSQLPEFAAAPAPIPAPVQPVRVVPREVEPVKAQPVQARSPAMTGGKVSHAATYYSKPIEEHREFPIFKILIFVLGVVIVALVVVNYFMVDQPFRAGMAKTSFANVQTHAHLGAFVQPNVLLIHILPNHEINSDNFADLLTALTQSAPHQAIAGYPFNTVCLTSAWVGQYALPVEDWSGFADMSGFSGEEKKQYVLSHLQRLDGQPLVALDKRDTAAQREARENEAWKELVAKFQGS